jgi:hypothetical protein
MKIMERLRRFFSGNNRICPKHGPFRFPPGCAACQRYFYQELAKGRDGWDIIFGDGK